MVNNWIEEHFPKSAAYINQVFERKGRELGEHYDFIADHQINDEFIPSLVNLAKCYQYGIISRRERNRREKEMHETYDKELLKKLKFMNKWHNHNI